MCKVGYERLTSLHLLSKLFMQTTTLEILKRAMAEIHSKRDLGKYTVDPNSFSRNQSIMLSSINMHIELFRENTLCTK